MSRARRRLIRVGVLGARRGRVFAREAGPAVGMELAAVCDAWPERLEEAGRELKVTAYADYDAFLGHDMDAVIVANSFHRHVPFAVKALRAGKHVMSETSACFTMAEGVELIREVEKSGKIYMLAENYAYRVYNQEMRRLYRSRKMGHFMYGESEYNHPGDADYWNRHAPGSDHWWNWIPATYYCTHALAPVMFITDTWPVKVNGFVMPYADDDPVHARMVRRNDAGSIIALRMDNGAVVKLFQGHLRGHSIWTRIHCSRGQMENVRRGMGDINALRVCREQWHERRTGPTAEVYRPEFPERHARAVKTGHQGSDFFMNHLFAKAIRTNKQPYFDVYRGVAMSIVGILAYRSALDNSDTIAVPDLRKPSVRRRYAKDGWSPDPAVRRPGQPWPSILGNIKPTAKGLTYAQKIWTRMGYHGK